MRLWSIHPQYLDAQGLVALWREGLLAKKVLEGNTKGYKNHPQLERFKNSTDPILYINQYLHFVVQEALARNYTFDQNKIRNVGAKLPKLVVTAGQLEHKFIHLKKKLEKRSPSLLEAIKNTKILQSHPLFTIKNGDIESWEQISDGI